MKKPAVNAVILTRTVDDEVFQMTKTCVESLLEHGQDDATIRVTIVESGPECSQELVYPSPWNTIRPDSTFNFHKFLNCGIAAQQADYYLLCNNDLLFHAGWLRELLDTFKVAGLGSASPLSPGLESQERLRKNSRSTFKLGYQVAREISGWCLLVSADTLRQIGPLDELFDFYFADYDYGLELRRRNIRHALVFDAKVSHLEEKKQSKTLVPSSKPPAHLIPKTIARFKSLWWIHESDRMIDGFHKIESKWGDYRVLRVKQLIHNFLFIQLGIGVLSKALFRSATREQPVSQVIG
jgi:GT2 family glycosyltransferase